MTTHSPEALPADLLAQIQHAIAHTGQADRCRLCGDEATQYARGRYYEPIPGTTDWRVHYLCDTCWRGPDDTGCCSYCLSYGVVRELKPSLYHCETCFQHELDSLKSRSEDESEDASW